MVSLETNLALQLPVIDFTSRNLKPGTIEWDSVRGNVRKALEDYGCFEALFDKVLVELRKAVFDASKEVFQLPLETKQRVVSKRKYRGYVGNTTFSESIMSFTEKVSQLDIMTRRMIMESFGLDENYINQHLKSTKCLIRLMKYQGVEETEEELDGLEVKTKDDKHWIKVNPSQDSSFIVLGGAMLHVFLNGRVLTGVHRVMRMGTNTRFSAGLFSVPKTEDLIYAPEEMVDSEHPRLYKPVDFEAYFQYTIEGSGRRDLSALRTYCGL
ncbi:hypothetical protein AALP_AA4G033500 [Arabis alpina]|uniref:Fe2OG dioxygenase domain-containing protein n=1 Tax=Arabis alpina TaxID=50452 RepID=A0A087H0W4_ARAAL|nr:hypothetical protein AALP_AA4G033500 [Arabis alpina]